MESKRNRYNALVAAIGVVFGMGGWVGDLYPSNITTFGVIGIFVLGFALVRFFVIDDDA